MIEIPDLTPKLLADLGKELGGCDFTDESQRRFLECSTSCDVQAVPGNGKTTLLAAKLALLSRNWSSRTQGVCVISHTNSARDEVERSLLKHSTASSFLSYPHFIGTVTSFVNQYLSLPYLRGLGWSVHQIDNDTFEATALRRYRGKQNLSAQSRMRSGKCKNQVETWVKNLELAADFESPIQSPVTRLKVRRLAGQHGPNTACGRDLEELKAALVNEGLFRFGDMTVLARKALDVCPSLADRLRQRFPLVLLDEAQDTNGPLLNLLDRIFGEGTVAFQRLGDQNQTLYTEPDAAPEDCWRGGVHVIPLTDSRRFGLEIANFASRLTARSAQQINGMPGVPSRRVLLLFDRPSIGKVVPAYASEIRDHWTEGPDPRLAIWAVASRHSLYKPRGAWPKSIVDYHPSYRAETGGKSAETLCRMMQKASLLHANRRPTIEVLDLLSSGIVQYMSRNGFVGSTRHKITNHNLWSTLAVVDGRPVLAVRRLFRDCVLYGTAPWERAAWTDYCHELRARLQLPDPPPDKAESLAAYLAFSEEEAVSVLIANTEQSTKYTTVNGVTIKLGSIHSVKGRTVDAIMIVESEVYCGPAANQQVMDLEAVLPHAFGITNTDFAANMAQLAAATNVFVGVTRAREFLALALRREATSDALLEAARRQGWHVRDLTQNRLETNA
jgi:DNA helicase II / ATP-dependent DNA helicase PcrA